MIIADCGYREAKSGLLAVQHLLYPLFTSNVGNSIIPKSFSGH